eukprot:gene1222-887_t
MRTAASTLLDGGYEEILRLTLVQIAQILLKGGAARTVHDLTSFSGHLQGRAEQMVDEELSAVLLAIEKLSGSVTINRTAAYSQVSSLLLRDLERVCVSGDHKVQLNMLRDNNQNLRNESSKVQAQLSEELARKEQRIQELEADKAVLEYKNASLLKTVDLLSSELERSTRTLSESQQNYVNLCLQSLRLKGDVDEQCANIVDNISSRIGFVPNNVMKAVMKLKDLKPPGNPTSDAVRRFRKDKQRKSKRGGLQSSVGSLNSSSIAPKGFESTDESDQEESDRLNTSSVLESSRLDVRADGVLFVQADRHFTPQESSIPQTVNTSIVLESSQST